MSLFQDTWARLTTTLGRGGDAAAVTNVFTLAPGSGALGLLLGFGGFVGLTAGGLLEIAFWSTDRVFLMDFRSLRTLGGVSETVCGVQESPSVKKKVDQKSCQSHGKVRPKSMKSHATVN